MNTKTKEKKMAKTATLANMLNTKMNLKTYEQENKVGEQQQPKKEKKTEVIILRVSKSEKEKISDLARDQALTPSQYIRSKILRKE